MEIDRVTPVKMKSLSGLLICFILLMGVTATPAEAYIGPGAGFAFLSSFMVIFVTFILAFVSVLLWPLRFLWKLFFRKRPPKTDVDRVVIVGLDGLSPWYAKQYMEKGLMPNMQKLAEMGDYKKLETVMPAMSPVAWSSFATGVDPSRHNQFDFLHRDPKTYLPDLSSVRIGKVSKVMKLGKYRIPLGKPAVTMLRKSVPFWKILGEYGIFSHILRVPITFPPEKHNGLLLSAMCVPDLRGSQGTFTYYTTDESETGEATGGIRKLVEVKGNVVESYVPGPDNTMTEKQEELREPFKVTINHEKNEALFEFHGEKFTLKPKQYSHWVRTAFKPGLGIKVWGLTRFYIMEMKPHFKLYVSPVQVDPEKPAMPISHPNFFSTYLAKLHGSFATIGFAEDTWALNERVIDEAAFLDQVWSTHEEREAMLHNSLDQCKKGLVVCVFDGTDRVQHMFHRYLLDDHPANEGQDTVVHKSTMEDLYRKADETIGRVMDKVLDDPKTVLMVMSDHGFTQFTRGINLNSWLVENGYMVMKDGGKTCTDWFRGVDWSKSKAYSFGLAGIYLNIKGREGQGIVEPGDADALREEIKAKMKELRDPTSGNVPVCTDVWTAKDLYDGPYREHGPDVLPGFDHNYRQSWEAAVGKATGEVISENKKAWSGDHCVDWRLVNGVLFSSRALAKTKPHIMDMAPSVLDLFGVKRPRHMVGRSFFSADPSQAGEEDAPPEERVANA